MAITTYAELKTALGAWLDRSDLTDYLGDFITFAEGHINASLRHRKMVAVSDLTPASNVCTLPDDYLHYVRVVELASIRRELQHIAATAADQLYPSRPAGLACHFMIVGEELTALPLSANDVELTYFQKVPALSSANTSNWLLEDRPELYLRTAQLAAMEFISEIGTPRYQACAVMAQKIIDDMNAESERAVYANTSVRPRMVMP